MNGMDPVTVAKEMSKAIRSARVGRWVPLFLEMKPIDIEVIPMSMPQH